MTRQWIWAAALIAIGSQLSLRAALTEELHKTYPLDADGRVSLNNVHGAAHITAWDRNEVQVDAVKTASSKEILNEAEIVIDSSGGSISIRTRYPDQYRRREPASVEYTVKVPRRARLSAIECVHGNVEIKGVTSDVKASSVHGNVEASFDRIDGASLISMQTVHGNIDLAVPQQDGLDISASTVHGRIRSDAGTAISRHHRSGGSILSHSGSGGLKVRLNTVHGDIRVATTAGGRRVVYV